MDSTVYGVYSLQEYSWLKSDCRAYNMMCFCCVPKVSQSPS